jgi:glycosyltransferase involved in cell wall biosynthesis
MEYVDRIMAATLAVNCPSYQRLQAELVLVYTEYFAEHLRTRAFVESERIRVIPLMHEVANATKLERSPKRVGFVARNFEEKGGQVLLRAYEQVREVRRDAELWIVGSEPRLTPAECAIRRITWLPVVDRDRLLSEVIPSFDIFAYPTPQDCFSYVLLEAMGCGIPVATSDYVSMPEAVDFGRAGLISPVGDACGLAKNILRLFDQEANVHYGMMARKRFETTFSVDVVAPQLRHAYDDAVASFGANGVSGRR